MTSTIDKLVDQLSDPKGDTRGLALAELVRRKAAAVPGLTGVLSGPDARARGLAAEGLGMIGAPSAADALYAALGDSDSCVRGKSAGALQRLGDPRALEAMLRAIADCPDVLHSEHTVATYGLMGYGPKALPALAPLLKDPDADRRRRAFTALRALVQRLPGTPVDWPTLHSSLGGYDPGAPSAQRDNAADEWAAWIRTHVQP